VTLVLSLLTKEYVVLASDRRLTWTQQNPGTKEVTVTKQEDSDTKTIALHGQFLMGFTGLARLRGQRVEGGVSDVLSKVEPRATFTALKDALQDEFRRLGPAERGIPHAFLAAGYVGGRGQNGFVPVSVVVANGLDTRGRWDPNRTGARFGISPEELANRRLLMRSVGWAIDPGLWRETLEVVGPRVRDNRLFAVEGVAGVEVVGASVTGGGRGLPRMGVPTRLIRKTSTCLTLPFGQTSAAPT
jgi:hypothetical protein